MSVSRKVAVALLLFLPVAACRSAAPERQTPIVQPGAPGDATKVLTAEAVRSLPQPAYTPADVGFMQGMIAHHAQAIEMTSLLETRSTDPDMKKLAQRIELSQEDEIRMMQDWLKARGQRVPDEHARHSHALMPGMLTQEELARLAAAKGPDFDRLFLESMIRHHSGALTMVKELFATPGAGEETDINAFASEVEGDQRMEIARMAAMLKERQR